MPTAAIYARYSPGRDRDQSSTIEAQVAMCREKAGTEGVTIDPHHIYIDRGISGATIKRDAFQQMLASIENDNFPNILYAKDDKRLFRNEREAGELVEWIWEHDIEIRYCLISFGDPRSSDEEWFLQRQFHLFAELERRRKAKETFEHQRQNALQGYANGGLPPYGYQRKEVEVIDEAGVRKKKLTWELNPNEAPAVELAFEMHLGGMGIKAIADALTKRGYRSRRGAHVNKATVGEWFRNPYPFAGCVVWNTRDHHLKPKPKSEWVIVEDAYPAIIGMGVAEEVYRKAEARRMGRLPKKRGNYLLSGMLKCSECEAAFIINSNPKRNEAFYVCGSRTRRSGGCSNRLMLHQRALEEQVTDWLKEHLLDPDFLSAYFERVMQASQEAMRNRDAKVTKLKRQLDQADGRIERLVEALADGELGLDVLKQKIQDEQEKKRSLESELRRYDEVSLEVPDVETFRREIIEALDDPETKKAALRGLVKQIIVHPDAALRIECSIQTCFHEVALRGIEPRFDG